MVESDSKCFTCSSSSVIQKIFLLVQVWSNCKEILNQLLMWMCVFLPEALATKVDKVSAVFWKTEWNSLRNGGSLKKKEMSRDQGVFKGLQKKYTTTFLMESIRTRSVNVADTCKSRESIQITSVWHRWSYHLHFCEFKLSGFSFMETACACLPSWFPMSNSKSTESPV